MICGAETLDKDTKIAKQMIDAIKACDLEAGVAEFNFGILKAIDNRLRELPVDDFKKFYSAISQGCAELIENTFEKRTNYGLVVAAANVIETITELAPSTAYSSLNKLGVCLFRAAHDGGMDTDRMKCWKEVCGTYNGILEKHPEHYNNYSVSNVKKAMEDIDIKPNGDHGYLRYKFEAKAMRRSINKMINNQEKVQCRVAQQYTSRHMFK